jgi:hypothetical protein
LDQQSLQRCASIEDKIESQYAEIRLVDGDPLKEQIKKYEAELGLGPNCKLALLRKEHSVGCYFIVSCEERLMQLHRHFVSGVMKNVLEKIFTLLANTDVVISHLRWDSKEYWQSMQLLMDCKARGQCIIYIVMSYTVALIAVLTVHRETSF